MGKHASESDSGSDSDSRSGNDSRSQSPQTAPTPGFSLEHHDPENRSRSRTPDSRSDRSRSGTPHSHRSGGSHRSRSGSINSRKSGSVVSRNRSHSGSPRGSRSRSGSRGSRHSRSRSGTPRSNRSHASHHSKSRSKSPKSPAEPVNNDDSRSHSPNLQIDDQAGSDRSRSNSKSRSRSGSRSVSRSKSGSKSKSRSRSRSKSGSRSRSRSASGSRHSRSRSRSGSGSDIGKKKKRKAPVSGSESDNSTKKTKKSKIIDSDSEGDGKPDVTADALFGDADDISTDDEGKKSGSEHGRKRKSRSRSQSSSRQSERRSSGEDDGRSRSREKDLTGFDDEGAEKEDEPEPIPETRINVEIPRIVTDLGKEIHFVKLPNFLSVETRSFDPETYEDEIDEEETMDEEGRQRIKLKVSNTIRWREYMNDKGNMVKESNARMIKWSDGSMSLHLGNEIFDVYRQPLQGDHNHLFICQGTGLQGQAVFRTKLTFRPHSTESFTHKKMTMSLADRSQKTSGIKILTQVGNDPTADRITALKKEEEKLRQAMRKQYQVKPKRGTRGSGGAHDLHHGPNSSYRDHDDGSDDDNGISLNAIKSKYKKNEVLKQGAAIYSSDDDDSDFEARRSKKLDKTKALKALRDSESESDGGEGADEKNGGEEDAEHEDGPEEDEGEHNDNEGGEDSD